MDTPTQKNRPVLKGEIAEQAGLMNFFQLCQLLEFQNPERSGFGQSDTPSNEIVRFKPKASLSFPAGEVAGIEYDPEHPDRPASVRTTFLGLYGVDSRMPYYFLDNIALRREGSDALAAFLDIFNHRISSLFYRAWSKYRYPVGFKANGTDCTSQYLLSLIGFGIGHAAEKQALPPARLLALLGPVSQKTRNRRGLASLLRYLLPDAQIHIEERFPVKVRVAADAGLGQSTQGLGQGCLLGKTILDQNRNIKISIQAANAEQALGLLPGEVEHQDLMGLLKIYLGHKFNAKLEMHIPSDWMPLLQLGITHTRLGQTALLASQQPRLQRINLGTYRALAA